MAILENTLSHSTQSLKLNGDRTKRHYIAEISNTTLINNKTFINKIALDFNLTLLGSTANNTLRYKLQINKRYFLDEKGYAIQKLSKVQQLAKTISSLNDELEIELSKNYKLIKVINTLDIRNKWEIIKIDILKDYPDLKTMINDFDWQLQEENIQQLFKEDNFYSFFFPNIFNTNFEQDNTLLEKNQISNGIGEINIPIIEKKHIKYEDRALTKALVTTEAKIDTNSKAFSIPKLNSFIGDLNTIPGNNYDLELSYKGKYDINAEIGLINKGELTYFFSIGDVYNKKTTIHFNLEQDE